ncbi:hypothetical protein [Saccharothrix yanglingensis]|uniref:Class I SAM-dependent methyltransferase n=1 Tax=Saccharothrix yanglingensis TaxID=659496 RepID=A0ABU0WVX3_9PSEU|nr:hypothetical protein [Saccharothrix yanglingensis]MDQ2583532.1 hypothetical protein [Saccharothrix yanglingensis]
MPTDIAGRPAGVLDAWSAPLVADQVGAEEFLGGVADLVTRRRGTGRVLVPGGGPVADALTGRGYAVTAPPPGGRPSGPRVDVVFSGADELSRFPVQRDQTRAVRRLAAFLRPGGALVVQGRHPDPVGWATDPRVTRHDTTRQTLVPADARFPVRYLWPAELDLMAELADLALDGRWGGWCGEPVCDGGPVVSVYRS